MSSRLEEIAQRLAHATPGPWHRIGWSVIGGTQYLFSVLSDPEKRGRPEVQQATLNLNFIAHAPTDVADLVDAVREARAIFTENDFCPLCGDDPTEHAQHPDCRVAAWLARWSESEGT